MSRPQNKDEFRREMADAFAGILEEKGLEWKKEWSGFASAPQNGVTKAGYRGCNAFWLSIVAMSKGYTDPRWVTMRQIQDFDGRYHPNEKWHLKKGSKAAYVEYWYPVDQKEKKGLTWTEYRDALKAGRKPDEFRLSTRYTPVFNACDIEGMPEIEAPVQNDISEDELIRLLSEGMGVEIINDGENLNIGINSRYLKDALSVIEDEEININFKDSVSPVIIKPLKGDKYTYLILPIRMN